MNYAAVWVAWRRAMRRHRHLPEHDWRLPIWRLIGGELVWAARQLAAQPWMLAGSFAGFAATLGVLSAAAPGPILAPPWRVLVAIAAGLLVAAGVRGLWRSLDAGNSARGARPTEDERPLVGAAVITGGLTVTTLMLWLAVWFFRWVA
jgi:hypothetical protein